MLRIILICIAILPATVGAAPAGIDVELWSRATVPGARSGAIYGRIVNRGTQPVVLTHLASAVAGKIEVHETVMEGGMMRMQARMPLELQPGKPVILAPGGLHIMMMKLNESLDEGSTFNLSLDFGDDESLATDVVVGSIGQMEHPE